ncbi:MAG TPA: ABC transporter substrate-binding protein [Alphaproteobacteria bacterium]|nr:ABC transporter substrate-binding protein [Alphaproteobacteria bacterium]
MVCRFLSVALAAIVFLSAAVKARAETRELRIAIQDGLAYLPFIVMDKEKLVEKHAKAAGLPEPKITWARLANSVIMNDGLLSGNLDIATGGVPSLLVLWSKTKGTMNVKSIGAWASVPNYLNVRNPAVKDVRDLTDKDRIAVPAVKVSNQAMYLQMLAEKVFGEAEYQRLDTLTVSLAHSDAMKAFLLPGSEITAHFTIEPYASRERAAGAKTLMSSFDILGGPATTSVMWATAKFHDENPKTYAAFVAAIQEAFAFIERDKKAAADYYIRVTGTKEAPEDIIAMLGDPLLKFGLAPSNIMSQADFMYRKGLIKVRPESWKDLFFPNVHASAGS